jgi:hypothetical protein
MRTPQHLAVRDADASWRAASRDSCVGSDRVVVIYGYTHQLLTNRIGNIHFHGMLFTAGHGRMHRKGCRS